MIATMRAMARRADEAAQALVELKAVDAAYPHGGTLVLEDGSTDGQALLATAGRRHSARSRRRSLLDRLGIAPGDRIRLGTATLEVRGVDPLRAGPPVERHRLRPAPDRSDRGAAARPAWCGPAA